MMKRSFSAIKILIFSLVLTAVFACALCRGINVDTSFFSIFPDYSSIADVEKKISRNISSKVNILVEADDFATAKNGAESFFNEFRDSGIFRSLTLGQNADQLQELRDFLFKYRYQLFDVNADPDAVAKEALAIAYSPFSFADLNNLEDDPFLLAERSFKKYMSLEAGNLFLKDGVLTCQKDGRWYVLIRGEVSDDSLSFSKSNGIEKVLDYTHPDVRYICSGVPFHSWESSSSAKREITWITTVSLIAVAIILLFAFRSVLPMLVSVGNITISVLFGLACVLAVFGRINVLAFVFGTTLIGVSIDYSIHFFVKRRGIFKSLTVNCISTEISWLLLMIAPFQLLRQIALFSASGLLCSYLIVILIYPMLTKEKDRTDAEGESVCSSKACRPCRYKKYCYILVLAFCFGIAAFSGIHVKNNIGGMYKMSDRLMDFEKTAGSVLGMNSTGEYYIVSGTGEQELLSREEELVAFLDGKCTAITKFIPSEKSQKKSYAASGALLSRSAAQLEALGFERGAGTVFAQGYRDAGKQLITSDTVPSFMRELFDALYLGESGGRYYSVVFPSGKHGTFSGENVVLVNKVKDIERELDHLTRIALIFILSSYLLVIPVIFFVYGKKVFKILPVPAAVILFSLAFVSSLNGGVDFFACAGIVLIFGLGLDYLVYSLEGKTGKATLLSFITTELSFGALALSRFVPVHTFGLTVFIGLILAYLLSRIYYNKI